MSGRDQSEALVAIIRCAHLDRSPSGATATCGAFLIVGAHALLRLAEKNPQNYPWLAQLLARRPFKVVAVALANKMARIAWVLLARGGTYRTPQLAAAKQEDTQWENETTSVRFMNCKGDEDIDAKRSRPSIGKPASGHARKERVPLIGTDQRITSGPAATMAAFRGRIHDCTRTLCTTRQIPLAPRALSTHNPHWGH